MRVRDIPREALEAQAGAGATPGEIASWWGVDHDRLMRRWGRVIRRARAELRMRLRARQIEMALQGHPVMLIWLGKQLLGQMDNPSARRRRRRMPPLALTVSDDANTGTDGS